MLNKRGIYLSDDRKKHKSQEIIDILYYDRYYPPQFTSRAEKIDSRDKEKRKQ